MEPRVGRGAGWVAYSAIVLGIAGIFGIIDGLMAVYKSTFFTAERRLRVQRPQGMGLDHLRGRVP